MLPDAPTLALFLSAATILLVTPGPAVLYIVARSVDQGRGAGFVSTLGIGAGTLFHVAAAAFGMSAILVSSALAFNMVKYLGAAYLVYLGVRTLLHRDGGAESGRIERRTLRRIFLQGVVVNLLNPKTALFFFAFLPQFVDVTRGAVALQILTLGCLFVLMGIVSDGIWAMLAGSAGSWLQGNRGWLRARRYFTGTMFVALGIGAALSGSGRK